MHDWPSGQMTADARISCRCGQKTRSRHEVVRPLRMADDDVGRLEK